MKQGPLSQLSYADLRNKKRQDARERIHGQVLHPIDTPHLLPNPLVHSGSRLGDTVTKAKLTVAAVVIHVLILLVFSVVNDLMGEHYQPRPSSRVVMAIVTTPKEMESEQVAQPLPADFPRLAKEKPAPAKLPKLVKPAKRARPKRIKKRATPEMKLPLAKTEPTPRQRIRIAGLSQESTVVGGKGAPMAIGASRMGETKTARNPELASPKRRQTTQENPSRQRLSENIPQDGVVVVKPKRFSPIKPKHPATLRAQGIEGDVMVRVTITRSGHVTNVIILKSSGYREFDDAARLAAQAERFGPATRDGLAISYTLSYSYRFRLEDT